MTSGLHIPDSVFIKPGKPGIPSGWLTVAFNGSFAKPNTLRAGEGEGEGEGAGEGEGEDEG